MPSLKVGASVQAKIDQNQKRRKGATSPTLRQCSKCQGQFNPRSIAGAVHLASCTKHNGYANYETCAVSLWIDNNQGAYDYWRDQARECLLDAKDSPPTFASQTVTERAACQLSKRIKSEIADDGDPLANQATVYTDLLGAALEAVDWQEIAEGMISEIEGEDGALMATDITQPRATVGQAALDAEIARLRGADVRAALREKILRSHGTRVALSESLLADAIAALLDRATNMSQED